MSLSGQAQSTRLLAGLDQPPDVAGAPRVEEDVALADRRLLGQQPRAQQRLADVGGELAVVAREAAGEVGEVGVVAAPLAHAVEPLEDPAGDAEGRVGILMRPGGNATAA